MAQWEDGSSSMVWSKACGALTGWGPLGIAWRTSDLSALSRLEKLRLSDILCVLAVRKTYSSPRSFCGPNILISNSDYCANLGTFGISHGLRPSRLSSLCACSPRIPHKTGELVSTAANQRLTLTIPVSGRSSIKID